MLKKLNLQYLISYSGLLPYLIILIDKYFFYYIKEELVINFALNYSLIIFVFIGSINWNLEANIKNHIIIYGFAPSFLAVTIIILSLSNFDQIYLLLFVIIFLALQASADYILIYSKKSNKSTFYFLRLPLTITIIFMLVGIIF